MAAAMAGFTMNDAITKAVSSEMNFGQIMLVRGVVAVALIAALAWHQGAMRPLRTLMVKPVALRVVGEIGGTISFMAASRICRSPNLGDFPGAAVGDHAWRGADIRRAGRLAPLVGDRSGVHRCAHHRAAGTCGLQSIRAARAGIGGVLRAARSRNPADTCQIPSLFITLLTTVTVTTAGGAILFRSAAGRRPRQARLACRRWPRYCS
jgi:hypothetical protein